VRLVEFQLAGGADGVATFGLASEMFALDSEERSIVLGTIVKTVRRHTVALPIVAGVGATGFAPALEQARQAVDAGADVLMVLPPFLVPASGEQLAEFYGQLAAECGVPIMVQDAPAATGVTMPLSLIADFARLPGVSYIKVEAQPTARKIEQVVQSVGEQLRVLGGQNAQFLLHELDRGAVGTMPACELTDLLASVMAARDAGDTTAAAEQFSRLLPLLVYGLQPGIAWAVHKEVLVRRKIISNAAVRLPSIPLDRASHIGLLSEIAAFEKEARWVMP
jgi:4-hydroxy-tetrahydrodipicolinate synthase